MSSKLPEGVEYVSIESIKRKNAAAGLHWFDPATVRCFGSRFPEYAFKGPGGTFFVSSERRPRSYDARRYTIREVRDDGSIGTVFRFQEYASRSTAIRHAIQCAEGARATSSDGGREPSGRE